MQACMRMTWTWKSGWWMITLAALALVPGCKKPQAGAAVAATAVASPTVATPSSWAVHSERLGFIAHLPADTEACFTTLNRPAHMAALKETNYYKDLTAFLDDKTPAPAAGTNAGEGAAKKGTAMPKVLQNLMEGDVFFSLGKGAAKSLAGMQQLSSIYTELTYRGIMAGVTPGAKPGSADLEKMLGGAAKDPDLAKRVVAALAEAQVPPMMMGMRTEKPEEALKELLPDALLSEVKKRAKVSQVSTNLNGKFTLIEATGRDLLTDEMKKSWLSSLPPDAAPALPDITKALDTLQAKPVTLAYGTAGGWVIVSLSSDRPALEFANDASTSLVSRPEFSSLATYEGKNLLAVFFAEGSTLQSLQNPEPLQPMARGVLGGLKESPMFAGMAKKLEGKVAALSGLEHKLYDRPMTTMAGAAWWDKGLHMEIEGGLSPKGLEAGKPLKFSSLLDEPGTIAAVDYHGDPQMSATLRAYVEGWAEVLHAAGLELAKANMFGEQGVKTAEWADKEIIPHVVAYYNGTKTLFTKAVGNEHAWVVDLGGHMPAIPGLPAPDPKADLKMVRIAAVDDMADRKLVEESWLQMNGALNNLVKAFPMLNMQKLPDPDSSNAPGITSYFYAFADSDDLVPCVSVGDKQFMLGTSKNQQEVIASHLMRAVPSSVPSTARWRISFANLREAVRTFSPAVPAPATADSVKTVTRWMEPFGDLRGRLWIEAGRVRNSVSWDVKDTTKFD